MVPPVQVIIYFDNIGFTINVPTYNLHLRCLLWFLLVANRQDTMLEQKYQSNKSINLELR